VTSRSQVATLAGQLEQIDVLVNNAGIGGVTSVDDMSDVTADAVRRTFDVNVLGLYWVTQALLPRLTPRGRIIFTTSYWAHTGIIPVVFVSGGLMEAGKITLGGKSASANLIDAITAAGDADIGLGRRGLKVACH
jgi:NAD(P)-dependent dehydrogenase (short-subunit alcohol dehydrogenase family)